MWVPLTPRGTGIGIGCGALVLKQRQNDLQSSEIEIAVKCEEEVQEGKELVPDDLEPLGVVLDGIAPLLNTEEFCKQVDSWKSAKVGVFIPQKLAKATNSAPSLPSWLTRTLWTSSLH